VLFIRLQISQNVELGPVKNIPEIGS